MNADEIVMALRTCNRSKGHRCSECPVFSQFGHRICKATVDGFAADMIENLQEQLKEEISRRYQAECNYDHWREQALESQRRERAAVDDLEGAGACFTCKHFRRNGGDCFGAGKCRVDGVEIFPCNEPGVYRVEVPDDGRKTYEWRGPQAEGGE